MKKAITTFLGVLALFGICRSEDITAPAFTPELLARVESFAARYQINPSEAVEQYRKIFAEEYAVGLAGIYFFEERKAYDVIALALPRMTDERRSCGLMVLGQKPQFSAVSCGAVVQELELLLNFPKEETSEGAAGQMNMARLAAHAVSQWLTLAPPLGDPGNSSSAYRAFIEQAKRRMVRMGEGNPY
jgi:hypothetical protein